MPTLPTFAMLASRRTVMLISSPYPGLHICLRMEKKSAMPDIMKLNIGHILNLQGCFRTLRGWVQFVILSYFSVLAAKADHWDLAQQNASIHRFSTLFTAQDVRNYLSSEEKLQQALDWCRKTAVSHVYIESFRDGYQADRKTMEQARNFFKKAGLMVSGCVTPTQVGKSSTGWKNTISCYTDFPTQAKVKAIFEFIAPIFDEIMIDDFWFIDCTCQDCDKARLAKTVSIGSMQFPVSGDTWTDYRCELMIQLSRENVLKTVAAINPNAKIIIKYPQWYERFHERGYEVIRQTADFHKIWVGTETRDYRNAQWGGTVQYEAYFIMRWLGGIGKEKCGGGWYDWLGTTEDTYLEQARQTILAGARESFLFCYGGLQRDTGPKNIEKLRANIPELFEVARQVRSREIIGIAAYKPANSSAEKEDRVFDYVGMMGLPLAPCHEFPQDAPAAFFSCHALKDPQFAARLNAFLEAGKPVLLTDGLVEKLPKFTPRPNVKVLKVNKNPKGLLVLKNEDIQPIRDHLLKPLNMSFSAPNQTGLYLYKDGSWAIENFNDQPIQIKFNDLSETIPARGWKYQWKQ